jgi:hypothetical protein
MERVRKNRKDYYEANAPPAMPRPITAANWNGPVPVAQQPHRNRGIAAALQVRKGHVD